MLIYFYFLERHFSFLGRRGKKRAGEEFHPLLNLSISRFPFYDSSLKQNKHAAHIEQISWLIHQQYSRQIIFSRNLFRNIGKISAHKSYVELDISALQLTKYLIIIFEKNGKPTY